MANNNNTNSSNTDETNKDSHLDKKDYPYQNDKLEGGIQRLQSYAGFFFVAIAIACFGATIYQVVLIGPNFVGADENTIVNSPIDKILLEHTSAILLLFCSVVGALLGVNLLRGALKARAKTIPADDRFLLEPLISDAKGESIDQYVRISSLTGSTGFFTKLGFTGLPLVTASLGILLILLAMLNTGELAKELLDLAKLVIGAFIGSFVQRKADQVNGPQSPRVRPEDAL